MKFLRLTASVGNNYHAANRKKPQRETEYTAQLATALPINSPLAVDWDGLLRLPGGGLAINDNPRAKMKAIRLGFAIGGAA